MALSKINPTKLSSWKKLFQQFDKENNYHINDFFKKKITDSKSFPLIGITFTLTFQKID